MHPDPTYSQTGTTTATFVPAAFGDYWSILSGSGSSTLTWDDKGNASSYSGTDITIVIKLTNVSLVSREYSATISLETVTAPVLPPPFSASTVYAITSNQNKDYTTPSVTEGTYKPATAEFEMSSQLIPFVTITA